VLATWWESYEERLKGLAMANVEETAEGIVAGLPPSPVTRKLK
jgi:hypothetical protein